MVVASEIAEMEAGLNRAGKTVKALCEDAAVSQSTWTRWKSSETTPNMATWGRVREAYEAIMDAAARAPEAKAS